MNCVRVGADLPTPADSARAGAAEAVDSAGVGVQVGEVGGETGASLYLGETGNGLV